MPRASFPVLPGLAWDVAKVPQWSTIVRTASSGRRAVASHFTYPLWRFRLVYEFLRSGGGYGELQSLIGFFNARRGRFEPFHYEDPDDQAVTDQVLAAGDGVTRNFRLVRAFGGFVEPIGAIKALTNVKVNGVVVNPANYALSASNTSAAGGDLDTIEFTPGNAPGAGLPVTATFSFYHLVAFVEDQTEFSKFLANLWENQSLELETVRL